MRLTKFNPETGEYEYIAVARTQEENNARRKAVLQRLGELEDRAEEIFTDLEKWLAKDGDLMIITAEKLAELKKKYTEGGE